MFFKLDIIFQYHNGWPSHFFTCAAPKCKLHAGGIHRYQDSKDKASTENLKHHALHCFGEDAINAAMAGKEHTNCNRGILALFTHKGKQPVKYSHHVHTNPEVQYVPLLYINAPKRLLTIKCSTHLVKWLMENNWPINIINDRELWDILTAGCPSIQLPTNPLISNDIHTSFEKCQD